jgi:hypothetical protein
MPSESRGEKMNKEKRVHNVILTKDAFRKLNDYAYIVSSIVGEPIEVMGLLIGEKNDPYCIANDAYLIKDQAVSDAESKPDDRSLGNAYYEITRSGKSVVGMWHSHGAYPNFHSVHDNDYLEHLVINNSFLYPNKRIIGRRELPYAMSVVVNENSYLRSNPFEGLKTDEHYFCCAGIRDGDDIRLTDGLELILIPSIKRINKDYLSLFEEVCANVRYHGSTLGDMFEEEGQRNMRQKTIFQAVGAAIERFFG